jgi:hypothetical protein
MGKICSSIKNTADICYTLLAKVLKRITAEDWISVYQQNLKK